jgi:hypothetical protein
LFPSCATGVIDICGKFAAGIVDTDGKFTNKHKRNWWQNLPPVSLIPAAVLSPLLLTPVANLPTVTMMHLDLRISPRIFEKIRNDPMLFSGAWGKVIHEKKT